MLQYGIWSTAGVGALYSMLSGPSLESSEGSLTHPSSGCCWVYSETLAEIAGWNTYVQLLHVSLMGRHQGLISTGRGKENEDGDEDEEGEREPGRSHAVFPDPLRMPCSTSSATFLWVRRARSCTQVQGEGNLLISWWGGGKVLKEPVGSFWKTHLTFILILGSLTYLQRQ